MMATMRTMGRQRLCSLLAMVILSWGSLAAVGAAARLRESVELQPCSATTRTIDLLRYVCVGSEGERPARTIYTHYDFLTRVFVL